MGGGLMQLVAYGAQDIYLTGNPQITFFKVVYRRHTNFSMEAIQQTINGDQSTKGGTGTVTVSRNGDLVSKIYVTSSASGITDGDEIIVDVELEIGGQRIDRHYKEWNQVWAELTTPESKAHGFKVMTGALDHGLGKVGTAGVGMIQIPLNFWFCRNPGLALPLIALQYHEVKLKFTWGSTVAVGIAAACQVWADYIYLDTDERRRFAQVSHEYLIEQLQVQSASASNSQKLNFNHPVKELIWTSNDINSYSTAQLKLNGHDRFAAQEEEYFQLRQPYDYHTSIPGTAITLGDHYRPTLLPVGKAALTDVIGFDVNNNITGGVVDIATAAGTNPKVGDTVAVHLKIPVGFSTPKYLATHKSTLIDPAAAGEFRVLAAATENFKIFTTDATSIEHPQLGDTVTLSYQTTSDAHVQLVATIAVIDQAPANNAIAIYTLQFLNGEGKVDHTPLASILSAGGRVGSAQLSDRLTLVKHGSSIVNAVATAGTDFTLQDASISTGTFDFKMSIISSAHRNVSKCSQFSKKINVYSFALKPEEHQPSGTCNFSRIDNAKLDTVGALEVSDNIYAVNYNVLRIMSGMGGLAYSN